MLLVAAWASVAAWQLVTAFHRAQDGMAAIDSAKSQLSGADLIAERPMAPLRRASTDFAAASARLDWPLLAPIHVLPVLGRQLTSIQDLSRAAHQVTTVGEGAIRSAHAVLQLPHHAGPERVATLRRISHLAATTHADLARVDLGPSRALLGPLASRRNLFVRQLGRVRSGLAKAASVTDTLAGVLAGPRQYLVLAANNAEMRSGSGTFLEVGALTTADGRMDLGSMRPTSDLQVPPGAVPITGELAARWGWLAPSQDFRDLGATPQFDVNAPLAAHMWQILTGQEVDGVLAVDIETLRELLTVTGPVTVAGDEVDASNVVAMLEHDQYQGLTDQEVAANQARKDRLGELARAAFQALETRDISLSSLASALSSAASGRHVMVWSADPVTQSAWSAAGVAGQLRPDSLLAGIINLGGNKLDQFLSVGAHLAFTTHGANTQAALTVTVHNRTPPGQSQYVAGPYPGLPTQAGQYEGVLAVNVPGDARQSRVQGVSHLAAVGAEGPTRLVAAHFSLLPGQSRTFVVRFLLPGQHGSLQVLPSARIPDVPWTSPSGPFTDASPHTVSW